MIILTHGNLRPRRFVCDNCGSEFIANRSEYSVLDGYFHVFCPECHYACYAPVAPCCYQSLPKNCISCGGLTRCIEVIDSKELALPRCKYFEALTEWRHENAKPI